MTVHPRSRGEHPGQEGVDGNEGGSSPLARGTPLRQRLPSIWVRFIPARAGNTRGCFSRIFGHAVHPRSRGEHSGRAGARAVVNGSSPLARGTRAPRPARRGRGRFIPARAGNTASSRFSLRNPTVHPRSRGEHEAYLDTEGVATGSSPLARGTPDIAIAAVSATRFIPARAGNTMRSWRLTCTSPVHPRSRGEHAGGAAPRVNVNGSSPLARGTPPSRRSCPIGARFIPARAGNTSGVPGGREARSVHPRSRGEHQPLLEPLDMEAGSSPLARGTH